MNTYTFERPEYFDITQIFDCGQSFRFDPVEDPGDDDVRFGGVAFGKYIEVGQKAGSVTLYGADKNDFDGIWSRYFALDLDYGMIRENIAEHFAEAGDTEVIVRAMEYGKGIRLLRQDPWEALCSFILSQNNNIPRIKGLIRSLSEAYGTPIEGGYAFPAPQSLDAAGAKKIFELKTGFRAKYLYDAAHLITNGNLDVEALKTMDFDRAEKKLRTVHGVGPKVTSCMLLFGCERYEAFPMDVWIKRVLEKYYPADFDVTALGPYAGIAQQYLFYYERWQDKTFGEIHGAFGRD